MSSESPPNSRRNGSVWKGVVIGIVSVLAVLALLAGFMFLAMGRCPMCDCMLGGGASAVRERMPVSTYPGQAETLAAENPVATTLGTCFITPDLARQIFRFQLGEYDFVSTNVRRASSALARIAPDRHSAGRFLRRYPL